MNDGRLTIWIDEREALPVRAIPYVAGWTRFSPDAVAAFLAQSDSWMRMTLTAHRFTATTAVPIKPREWDAAAAQIKGFEAELRRQHGDDETGDAIGYAAWRRESLMHLPAGVYVWLDDFEREYLADRNSPLFFETLPSDGELILTPMIDANTMAMVMEGFQSDTVTAPEEQAAPTRSPSDDERTSPVDDADHTEKLAALFDPVPVEALEKMFPASGKWKNWADKAKSNGLIDAREGTAKFNPFKAGTWFVHRGVDDWDNARLYRTLANNLPARSRDDKHLLTGDVE